MATILIIEDNGALARQIAGKFPGHKCVFAQSYASAVEVFDKNQPVDFIISGLQIPPTGMSKEEMGEYRPYFGIPFIKERIESGFDINCIVVYSGFADMVKGDPRPSVSMKGIKMIQKSVYSLNELEKYVNGKLTDNSMSLKKFLYKLFHKREGLSYFLLSIVFLFFFIAIMNFTTSYLHCRRDIARVEDLYMTDKNITVTDDVNTVVLDTVITTIMMRDTVTVNIVVRDTVKNDYSRHCTNSSLEDVKRGFETLEDLHKTFDNNLLTFLISFVLVAVLTMLIHDSSELHERLAKLKSSETSLSSIRSDVERELADLNSKKAALNSVKDISNKILKVSLLPSGSKLLTSIIESSKFIVNDTASTSISKLGIRLDDFSREIPEYSPQLRDEALFANEDIDSMLRPLYDVQQDIEDLYRSAKDYESKLRKRNPNLVPELVAQLSPVESSIDALIRKIEGYRAAPKNQQE